MRTLPSLLFFLFFYSVSAQDDVFKEAAKTEIYTPVPKSVEAEPAFFGAPSDAIILFNGKNLDAWMAKNHTEAQWNITNGILTVNKKSGDIITKEKFTDYQLHLEFMIPENISGEGQSRGNSGIFLAYLGNESDGYELQILDSYQNKTYVNGQSASIYKQTPPLVNASRKPGEWQSYDISWTAPRFDKQGNLTSPAYLTVFLNGVLVQNHVALKGQTLWVGQPYYKKHGASPIMLQAHNDPSEPIYFRNIWIRKL